MQGGEKVFRLVFHNNLNLYKNIIEIFKFHYIVLLNYNFYPCRNFIKDFLNFIENMNNR